MGCCRNDRPYPARLPCLCGSAFDRYGNSKVEFGRIILLDFVYNYVIHGAMSIFDHIEFVEVGPRDGLQNEAVLVSTENKLALINRAIDAGARRIEVTSFVNPKRVPQMADAEDVCAGLPDRDDITFIGLVMNLRGAERAIASGKIDQLGAVAVATDTFAMANQGQSSNESVEAAKAIIALAHAEGRSAQCTIAASFGCPFEGEVADKRVIEMAVAIA